MTCAILKAQIDRARNAITTAVKAEVPARVTLPTIGLNCTSNQPAAFDPTQNVVTVSPCALSKLFRVSGSDRASAPELYSFLLAHLGHEFGHWYAYTVDPTVPARFFCAFKESCGGAPLPSSVSVRDSSSPDGCESAGYPWVVSWRRYGIDRWQSYDGRCRTDECRTHCRGRASTPGEACSELDIWESKWRELHADWFAGRILARLASEDADINETAFLCSVARCRAGAACGESPHTYPDFECTFSVVKSAIAGYQRPGPMTIW